MCECVEIFIILTRRYFDYACFLFIRKDFPDFGKHVYGYVAVGEQEETAMGNLFKHGGKCGVEVIGAKETQGVDG